VSGDRELVDRIRQVVGEALSREAERAEARNSRLSGDDRRMLAHKLISDELLRFDTEAMNAGREVLADPSRDELATLVLNELFAFGRLQPLLDDDDVTDVVANGCDQVFVTRRGGRAERVAPIADSDEALIEMVQAAARRGRAEHPWDPANPMLNLQLPSGARLNAVAWVSDRPSLSIRRHDFSIARLKAMIGLGTITEPLFHLLQAMVRARFNIIVAGGTSAGKTTLMRCLINEISPAERLVTVEDSMELAINRFAELHPNCVSLEARPANVEGVGEVTMDALAINALRMAPDRLIVGEVRGDEALTLLLACTQGNDGSLCTVHANSSAGVFGRLAMYLAMTPERFQPEAANLLIAQAIDVVVHLAKLRDGRRVVTSVREVTGAEDLVISNEIYAPDSTGRASPRFTAFSEARLARLIEAGFEPRWLDDPGEWHQ
jgi:Flp pilus assembly CpaF family ATPase